MTSSTTWVIAKTKPGPSGKPFTSYWTDMKQVIGGFAFISPWSPSLGPPSGLTGSIRTFGSKQEAKAAYRGYFRTFPRDLDAVALTAEQAALIAGSGNTSDTEIVPQEAAEAVTPVPAEAWVIRENGTEETDTTYWSGGGYWRRLCPTILTWPSKAEALAATREKFGKMPRGCQAAQLSDEEAVLVHDPAAYEAAEAAREARRIEFAKSLKAAEEARKNAPQPGTVEYLDQAVREEARAFNRSWQRLEGLIAEAKARAIHTELGFKSWPDYIADVARREMPNVSRSVDARREVVALLADEDMSNRAIAAAIGVSEPTVRRDRAVGEQVRHDDAPEPAGATAAPATQPAAVPKTRTGLDGKNYPAERLTLDERNKEREARGLPPVQKARKLTPGEGIIRFLAQNITPVTEELPERLARVGMENITVEEARQIRAKLLEAIRLCELALEKMGR